jgi:hypothetical protein
MEFWSSLMALPDALMGAARYPKITICAILLMCASVVVVERHNPYRHQATPNTKATVQTERRITKVVRWLWAKE